jgi:hypothetical protein
VLASLKSIVDSSLSSADQEINLPKSARKRAKRKAHESGEAEQVESQAPARRERSETNISPLCTRIAQGVATTILRLFMVVVRSLANFFIVGGLITFGYRLQGRRWVECEIENIKAVWCWKIVDL